MGTIEENKQLRDFPQARWDALYLYWEQSMDEHSVEERSKVGPEIDMLEEVFHGLSSVKVS